MRFGKNQCLKVSQLRVLKSQIISFPLKAAKKLINIERIEYCSHYFWTKFILFPHRQTTVVFKSCRIKWLFIVESLSLQMLIIKKKKKWSWLCPELIYFIIECYWSDCTQFIHVCISFFFFLFFSNQNVITDLWNNRLLIYRNICQTFPII